VLGLPVQTATTSVPAVKRRWWFTAAAVLGLVVLAWAATAGTEPLWHDADPVARQDPASERVEQAVDSSPPIQARRGADDTAWDLGWLLTAFAWAVLTGLLALLLLALVRAWRRRPQRHRIEPTTAAALPTVAETVNDAEAELQEVLLRGSPRNAIVRCWVRLEQAVAAAGIAPRPSETSLEFTTRVLAAMTVDDASLRRLGALYREARFSRHELGEPQRRAAIASLTELLEQVGTGRPIDGELVP
jgi:hypothetical protein